MEQTLSIIKPDAVKKGVIGSIIARFESNGLRIAAMKKLKLSKQDAQQFYAVHKEQNAVSKNRELMGATNPKEAAAGTIRADFADSIEANAVHGSDSLENAKIEISFFFSNREIC